MNNSIVNEASSAPPPEGEEDLSDRLAQTLTLGEETDSVDPSETGTDVSNRPNMIPDEQHRRSALEAYAAFKGHPSVEAWLRSLLPQEFDKEAFNSLAVLISSLTPAEDAAAAALFFGFAEGLEADPPSYDVFHPSLLEEEPLVGDGTMLMPAYYNNLASKAASR
jgi:hypothetical protein